MSEIVVNVTNLDFSYDRNKVLNNVNIQINKGEYVGLLGSNGSAKSTLIKLILGLLKPDKGKVELFGTNINKFSGWSRIGYLSQQIRNFNFTFPATVEEIVAAGLYSEIGFLNRNTPEIKRRIEEALKKVNMQDYKHRLIGNLSGGQQQRVFISRILVNNPEIIFMDEPLVGIDSESQDIFYLLMEELNKKFGITIVIVSHDVVEITSKVNKILCINNGEVFTHSSKSFIEGMNSGKLYSSDRTIINHRH